MLSSCVFSGTEKWRKPLKWWNTGTAAERTLVDHLCSSCSSTTSTPSWRTSRASPSSPGPFSTVQPLRELNLSCVDCSPDRLASTINNVTRKDTHTHTHTHPPTHPPTPYPATQPHMITWQMLGQRAWRTASEEGFWWRNKQYPSAEAGLGGRHPEQQFCGDSFLWTLTCFGKSHRGSKITRCFYRRLSKYLFFCKIIWTQSHLFFVFFLSCGWRLLGVGHSTSAVELVRTTWTSCLVFALLRWTVTAPLPSKLGSQAVYSRMSVFFSSSSLTQRPLEANTCSQSSFCSLKSGLTDRNCCVIARTCAGCLPGCCLWTSNQTWRLNGETSFCCQNVLLGRSFQLLSLCII